MTTKLASDFFILPPNLNNNIKEMNYPQKVIIGRNAIMEINKFIKPETTRVLIVTYSPGRFSSKGVVESIQTILSKINIETKLFLIPGTPDTDLVDLGVEFAKNFNCQLILCIGGGTVLDAGKLIASLVNNPGNCEEYQNDQRLIINRSVPVIAVPTTAGSGSEATSVSVIKNKNDGFIKSVSSTLIIPPIVILDPALIEDIPPFLAATSGLDAFSHAMESFTSLKSSQISQTTSLAAGKLIYESLPKIVNKTASSDDYANLMIGSHLAGQALNAGVGAAHIFAQPITAVTGCSHGLALSTVLKEVIVFNEVQFPKIYDRFISYIDSNSESKGKKMSELIEIFMTDIGLDRTSESILSKNYIPEIINQIVLSTSHIWTNPRIITLEDLEGILERSC
jgi:alcohol dehydrogenase class IV